jgi:methylated-DNA-[protein]-cysteine S-methyltransferase
MTGDDDHRLITALSRLSVAAPVDLMERITAHWALVHGPVEDAYVTVTTEGISGVVPASTVMDAEAFVSATARAAGRPLVPAGRPPDGVAEALETGRSSDLRFDLRGLTLFERSALTATLQIPPGELRPYGWIALQIDRPNAVRAVGTALGNNPIPLLIPCHRVIRMDGDMGEYGFGREMKRRLLDSEGVDVVEVESLVRGGARCVGSDTNRVVCMPTCRRLRENTGVQRHGFRLVADAVAAGYRPCEAYRPTGR